MRTWSREVVVGDGWWLVIILFLLMWVLCDSREWGHNGDGWSQVTNKFPNKNRLHYSVRKIDPDLYRAGGGNTSRYFDHPKTERLVVKKCWLLVWQAICISNDHQKAVIYQSPPPQWLEGRRRRMINDVGVVGTQASKYSWTMMIFAMSVTQCQAYLKCI